MNTSQIPPGGWQFRQPQTNWQAPTPISSTFDQTVVLIIQHRMKNPAVVARHRLSVDRGAVSNELLEFNRVRLGLPRGEAPPQSFFVPSRSAVRSPVAVAEKIKRAAQAAAVPIDWISGGGKIVPPELANRRASICAPCVKNTEQPWYVQAAAKVIEKVIQARADVKLQTDYDDKLKGCDVCNCIMRLKVHTPLDVILRGTKPEVMAEFPEWCWIARKDQ
jgi:hypothetical protein